MNILGVDAIHYGSKNVELAIKYYQDWGLTPLDLSDTGGDFANADGTTVHIRSQDDTSLPPAVLEWEDSDSSTAREVIWGVDNGDTLQAIGAELSRDREVVEDSTGTLHCFDEQGFAIGFRVSRQKAIELQLPETNTVGRYGRINYPAEGALRRRIQPQRFGHVVYWVRGDLELFQNFYQDRLGFKTTDNLLGAGAFMRSGGSTDHHTLFLQQRNNYVGFQHVSFEVRYLDEVMLLGSHMEEQGWLTNVGPGRHNISSTISWYMWSPAGGLTEVYCDIDYADDGWEVRNVDTNSEEFYGFSWCARPEQKSRRVTQMHPEGRHIFDD